jgi:hypothetical protein
MGTLLKIALRVAGYLSAGWVAADVYNEYQDNKSVNPGGSYDWSEGARRRLPLWGVVAIIGVVVVVVVLTIKKAFTK